MTKLFQKFAKNSRFFKNFQKKLYTKAKTGGIICIDASKFNGRAAFSSLGSKSKNL